MLIIPMMIYAFFLFLPAEDLLAEEILMGYEYDIDQQIVKPVSAESNEKSYTFIYKKFLEKRKSHANPERSRIITYGVGETNKKEIPFLDIGVDDAHAIGRISKVNDGYVIPVIRAGKLVELYNYMPNRGVIQRIDSHKEPIASGFVDKVFALANGYVAVTSVGAELSIGYHHYDGSLPMMVDLGDDASHTIISIDDVIESGGRRYILASSAEEEQEGVLSLWVYSFDSQFDKASRVATRLMQEAAMSLKSRFIYSNHNFLSIQAISRTSLHEPPIVKLLAFNGEPKLVRRFTLSTVEGDDNFALAGICNNSYVFAKKLIPENGVSTNIEYEVIDSAGKQKRAWTEQMVIGGSIINLGLYPSFNSLFSFVNYSKIEDVRRKDGWYSWLGYRVDRFDTQKDCD